MTRAERPVFLDLKAKGQVSAHQLQRYEQLSAEKAKRSIEALKLYEPMPWQDAFHRTTAKEVLVRKAIQTGGSLAGFVEDARAVTNSDPYNKYPKEGLLVCLGFGEKHIGRVIHKYLFRSGAFQIIRDLDTAEWRTFRPWSGVINDRLGDFGRESEARKAPPLIPPRLVESIAWERRREHVFSYAKLKTGWEIYACNTAGDPGQAQGFLADLVHIDEDTATEGWYAEMMSRLTSRNGKMRWTAVPHSKNDEMMNLMERAEDEKGTENPQAVMVTVTMFDNIYYPEESRKANAKIWLSQGEDVYKQRALGELPIGSRLMYPTFNTEIHNAVKETDPRLAIQKILADNNGIPPADWTRYYAIDPGHTVCAVVCGATPPPALGDFRVIYKEIYIRNCDANMFGDALDRQYKSENNTVQAFIIDAHGASLREIGSGLHPRKQYENQLKARGIKSVDTEFGFKDGCDDVKARENEVREWLRIRQDGTTKLLIVVSQCPNLVREMKKFKKKTTRMGGVEITLDEGQRRGDTHAIDCLEMMVASQMQYIKPKTNRKNDSYVDNVLRARKQREKARAAKSVGQVSSSVILGPRGSGSSMTF